MKVRILGCGDAFGSGGRFNTCFHVARGEAGFLVDCGASSMIAMRKFGVDPNSVRAIFLSHLHADHYGGLPFFILDAQFVSGRTRPLTVVGPQGLAARLAALMEAQFPGSSRVDRKFDVELLELTSEVPLTVAAIGAMVIGYPTLHPSGSPAHALRIVCDGRTLSYTGDTEWVDALVPAAHQADLLIAEAYCAERKVRFHLDFATLRDRLPAIAARRIVLTHMSEDMLAYAGDLAGCEKAEDGLVIDL